MTDTSKLFLSGKKSKATNTAFEKKFSQGEPFSQHLNYHEIEIYMDVNRCRKKVKMEVLLLDGLFLVKKLFIVFVSCDAVFIVNSQPIQHNYCSAKKFRKVKNFPMLVDNCYFVQKPNHYQYSPGFSLVSIALPCIF